MEAGIPMAALGIYVAIGCVAPFAIYTAGYLIRRGKKKSALFSKKNIRHSHHISPSVP
ncbi:MAG: hypothetical protein ACLTAF_12000 [Blautia coccoides]